MAVETLSLIRETIRQRIRDNGYDSFERFAYENGIDKTTLSRLLSGKREPKISTLLKIAKSLELTLNDLYLPTGGTHVREKAPAYGAKKARKRKVTLVLAESDIAALQEKLRSSPSVTLQIRLGS